MRKFREKLEELAIKGLVLMLVLLILAIVAVIDKWWAILIAVL